MRRVVTDFAVGLVLLLLVGLVSGGLEDAVLPATAFGVFFAALALLYRQWEKRQQLR